MKPPPRPLSVTSVVIRTVAVMALLLALYIGGVYLVAFLFVEPWP